MSKVSPPFWKPLFDTRRGSFESTGKVSHRSRVARVPPENANSSPLRIQSEPWIDLSTGYGVSFVSTLHTSSAEPGVDRIRHGRRKAPRNGRSFDVSRSLRYQSRCRLEWRGVSSGRDRGWRAAHSSVQGLEGRLDGRSVEWKGETQGRDEGEEAEAGDLSHG